LTGNDVVIRRCRRNEVNSVLQLWSGSRSAHASLPDRPEDVERLIDDDNPAALLVAEADQRVVGAVIAAWDGWRGTIYRLAVDAEQRRTGVGLQLTRAAEDYFRERDVERISALVPFEDRAASAFWDAAGYPSDPAIGRRVRNI
jgi:ribosomal protein S18 acetylase RimI-like enzyme